MGDRLTGRKLPTDPTRALWRLAQPDLGTHLASSPGTPPRSRASTRRATASFRGPETKKGAFFERSMFFVRRSSSCSPGEHPMGGPSSDADLSLVKDHNAKLRELLRKADAEK